ncbi:MAG: hypothetical protein ACREPU_05540, partial [Rhodanobacteraceae bacterium]
EFVRQPGDTGVADISLDGQLQSGRAIELADDGKVHDVLVRFGKLDSSWQAVTSGYSDRTAHEGTPTDAR